MVKLGFIVEGATEKIVLTNSDFFKHLASLHLSFIENIIYAEGNGNLLPKNIEVFTGILKEQGATHIFILTDLDKDECISNTKARIAPLPDHIVIVSVKSIEAWFLSDTEAMRSYLKDSTFEHLDPESVDDPYEEIKSIRMSKINKGTVSKTTLANAIVKSHNFSVIRAAAHPNCNSAKYFLKMIAQSSHNS